MKKTARRFHMRVATPRFPFRLVFTNECVSSIISSTSVSSIISFLFIRLVYSVLPQPLRLILTIIIANRFAFSAFSSLMLSSLRASIPIP